MISQQDPIFTINNQRQSFIIKNNNNIQHKSTIKSQQYAQYKNNVDEIYEHSQSFFEQNVANKEEQIMTPFTQEQNQKNIKLLERLWEYRYVRNVDYALQTNDWFKLFSFVHQFKIKCIHLVKNLINNGLFNAKSIDEIDHRYNLKGQNQDGIYLEDGIIMRVARIKAAKLQNGTSGFSYNGLKYLHQEFSSLNILNNLSISLARDMPGLQRIRVPISCLVKYMGFTVLCQADSPCQGLQTLVHGPTGTIYQYREQYMDLLRIIGKNLNLKQFTMLSSDKKSVNIPFSLTLQLHKIVRYLPNERFLSIINKNSILYPPNGTIQLNKPDFYLVNIAKLWPLFIDSDIIKSVGYLRPQVVISSKTPLSNVVFCQVSEKPDQQGQLQLADACKRVKEDHISTLAKMLDNTTIFLVDSQGIQDILHQYGINIRYIGSLAQKVNLDFNKKILQTEMIARACKRYFFKTFHEIIFQNKSQNRQLQLQFRQCFVQFLNLLFIKTKQGQNLYKNYIYTQISRYYDYKITSYPPQMQGGGILHALSYHFGVKLKIIDYPFFQNIQTIFNVAHILDIHGSAKSYDFDTTQIKHICKNYKEKRKQGRLQECIKELKILSKIHHIMNTQKTQNISPLPEAYFWTELSQIYFKLKNIQQANRYAELALKAIPQKHSDAVRPFQILLKCHSHRKQMNKSVQFYEKSLNYLGYHLGTNHPMTITVYNSFAYEQLQIHDPSKCQKMFLKSLQISQRSLGYTHSTSSQILLQLAQLPLTTQKKISYYLQGLNILQNIDSQYLSQKIRKVCIKISQMYEKTGNLQKMISFAKRSGYWQLQIKGQSKQNLHKSVLILANRFPASSDQCAFIIFYAFRSYIKILPKLSRQNLYKLFVAIKSLISDQEMTKNKLDLRLKQDKMAQMTVTQFLRNIITHLVSQLPSLIIKPSFYKRIFQALDPEDKKLKNSIQSFIDIVSVLTQDKTEIILTQDTKNQ